MVTNGLAMLNKVLKRRTSLIIIILSQIFDFTIIVILKKNQRSCDVHSKQTVKVQQVALLALAFLYVALLFFLSTNNSIHLYYFCFSIQI